jgi:protein-disulfide isomerase
MSSRVERLLSVLLTIAAIVIAAGVARREFAGTSVPRAPMNEARLVLVQETEWRSLFDHGVVSGRADAPIQVVQFADLECPACRDFELKTLSVARAKYGERLAIVYVHFPLSYHRFARMAAQAAECAEAQGRFVPFVSSVYTRQDSIGLKPWVSYAVEAGVPDTAAFGRCVQADELGPRIGAGFELGQQLQVRGTPTVMVNGWRFASPPSLADLTLTIDELLEGRRPSLASGPDR